MSLAVASDRSTRIEGVAQLHVAPTVWGLGLSKMHDRYWASRGLQVVRPGGTPPDSKGPELYLLLPPSVFVDFPIGTVLRSIAWLRPKAARIRLISPHGSGYGERVIREDDGRFLAFERNYRNSTTDALQTWVTPSLERARLWNTALSPTEANARVRASLPREKVFVTKLTGSIFDTHDDESVEAYRRHVLSSWPNPATVIDGVYQPAPGVWIHETCEIHEDARIIGPAWIGVGHRLEAGETLVGPAIVPDEPLINPDPGAIDWWSVTHSGWRLIPQIRRRPVRAITKRVFDLAVSLAVLAVTLPFYPIIMWLIWREDGGSPFFIHRRQRFGGKTFGCIKFRTMRLDAEEIKQRLIKENQADGPQFFMKNDPRLLRHGGWMRKYKIDEFPQFINVLLGHMSIVGPRPSPDKENQYCPAWREARLSVRPGITGLWQVASERKPQTDFQEWIRYDLEYVQTNSWRLDLAIIFATIKKILS